MNRVLWLICLFCGPLLADYAVAANRYVRAGATGNGSGTDWTNAYPALPSSLVRGDTYYIADGTYAGRAFSTATSGSTAITIKKATQSDHGADAGWNATFGDGQAIWGALDFTTANWVFDGVTGGGPGSWKSGFGFKISVTSTDPLIDVSNSNADSITIRHVELQGNRNSNGGGSMAQDAIAVRGGDGVTLSYFYMNDIGRCPFFLVPAPNMVIEYGYIGTFVSTSAAHAEVMSAWAGSFGTALTFRYNVVGFVTGTGGIMWDNSNDRNSQLRIYGNIFWRDPAYSGYDNCCNGIIGGWTGGNGEDFYNARVFNNTFININEAEVLSTFPQRSGNNEARNNLFYTITNPGGASRVWQTVSHNQFFSTSSIGTSITMGTGNPFVDFQNLDFRLTSSTTSGLVLAAPYTTDMYGNARGADGTWDRGAVEFLTGSPTRLPAPGNLRIVQQ